MTVGALVAAHPAASAAAPGGHEILAVRGGSEPGIVRIDPRTGTVTQVITDSAASSPRWSPDGGLIAWRDTDGDDREIYVARRDGKRRRAATHDERDNYDQDWAPGANRMVVVGWTATRAELFVIGTRGGTRRLTRNDRLDWQPDWSPRAALIAFSRSTDYASYVYTIHPDGTRPQRLTRGMAPRSSPDGRRILFARNRKGSFENDLFVMRADGSRIRRLTRSPAFEDEYSWAPDGSAIAFVRTDYVSPDDHAQSLWHMRPNGKRQRRLTSGDLSADSGYMQAYYPTWSLSGHRVAYTRFAADGSSSLWVVRLGEADGEQLTPDEEHVYTPNWFTVPVELQAGAR